jgi:hypothetical protein
MHNYVNATQNTRTLDRFEYYLEDMDCKMCKYWRGKRGCGRAVCSCEDERTDVSRTAESSAGGVL